jgi:hypothetical protein
VLWSRNRNFFPLEKPEPQYIPEPDLEPDSTSKVIQKSKDQKLKANFLGNNAASSIEKSRLHTFFVVVVKLC